MPPPCIIYSATARNKSSSFSDWLAVSKRGYCLHGKDARSSHIILYLLCYPFLWSISPRSPKMQGAGITQLLSSAAKATVCVDDTEMLLLLFHHAVVSDFLRSHGRKHARPPCPSPFPGVYSNSYRYHPAFSSSDALFFLCPQSFPASGSCPRSQLFPSDDPNSLSVWTTQKMYRDAI